MAARPVIAIPHIAARQDRPRYGHDRDRALQSLCLAAAITQGARESAQHVSPLDDRRDRARRRRSRRCERAWNPRTFVIRYRRPAPVTCDIGSPAWAASTW